MSVRLRVIHGGESTLVIVSKNIYVERIDGRIVETALREPFLRRDIYDGMIELLHWNRFQHRSSISSSDQGEVSLQAHELCERNKENSLVLAITILASHHDGRGGTP